MLHRHSAAATVPDNGAPITRENYYIPSGEPLQVFLLATNGAWSAGEDAVAGDTKPGYDASRFTAWMRREMRRREWIAADVARAMDINPGQISQWLNGKKQPSTHNARRLADLFAVDADTMLALTGHRPDDTAPDDETERLVSLLRRVDLVKDRRGDAVDRLLLGWYADDQADRQGRSERSGDHSPVD